MLRPSTRGARRATVALLALAVATSALLALGACSTSAPSGSAIGARDADGRPLAPGPPSPSTCVTRTPSGEQGTCVPVHNPPSRLYVEQAMDGLLRTRAYTSIEHVRCSARMPGAPADSDPTGLDAFSHWACVGQEIRGRYLHEDVIWSPSSGRLTLNAVTRDLSPRLTLSEPNDPGLPNPYLPEQSERPSPSGTTSEGGSAGP